MAHVQDGLMAIRGRRPIPTAIKILRGNPGKRRLPEHEPRVEATLPLAPKELDAVARKEWFRVGRLMRAAGMISKLDRAVLATYCQAWARWLEAETKVRQSGLVVKTKHDLPMMNPYLHVANTAMKQLAALAVELGLSPSSRTRIKAVRAREEENKWLGLIDGQA